MVRETVLSKLIELNLLSSCLKEGLISYSSLKKFQWQNRYDELIRLGSGKMDAYATIADENGVSEGYVRKVVKDGVI